MHLSVLNPCVAKATYAQVKGAHIVNTYLLCLSNPQPMHTYMHVGVDRHGLDSGPGSRA